MLAACTISNTARDTALGRPWPPCSGAAARPFQPPLPILTIGVGETGSGDHLSVLEFGPDLVAGSVQGRQHVVRQRRPALQHRLHRLQIDFGEGLGVHQRGETRRLGQGKYYIAGRGAETHEAVQLGYAIGLSAPRPLRKHGRPINSI